MNLAFLVCIFLAAFLNAQTIRIAIHSELCTGGEISTLSSQLNNPNFPQYNFTLISLLAMQFFEK